MDNSFIYINVSVWNYINQEIEGYQSSHPSVLARSMQQSNSDSTKSGSGLFWGWQWNMKTPLENIDPRSYVLVEINTYQKSVTTTVGNDLIKQSPDQSTNSTSPINKKRNSNSIQPISSPATQDDSKSSCIDCLWGVFILDVPKLKYFASSMVSMQPYPIPSPLNPTSRSNPTNQDYSRCLNVDIMLSKNIVHA